MKYTHIVFSAEGTLIAARQAAPCALDTARVFIGVREALDKLKKQGCKLGIITSQNREEYAAAFLTLGLSGYFDTVVCADDAMAHRSEAEPMRQYLARSGAPAAQVLYIGGSSREMQCALAAAVDFGLAVWGCPLREPVKAKYYFNQPFEIHDMVRGSAYMPWLKWAMELQSIAQTGLAYSRDVFDIERFTRIREISAEILSLKTEVALDTVKALFCNETGFQTPKLDTRAAIIENGKILLVKEKDGQWALPGGWVDVTESIQSNTIKEAKEEAGVDVVPYKLVALHDRNRHNVPPYAYGICKAFVLCRNRGGAFEENAETEKADFFPLNGLPPLTEAKNTAHQIKMCFDAYEDENWITLFD